MISPHLTCQLQLPHLMTPTSFIHFLHRVSRIPNSLGFPTSLVLFLSVVFPDFLMLESAPRFSSYSSRQSHMTLSDLMYSLDFKYHPKATSSQLYVYFQPNPLSWTPEWDIQLLIWHLHLMSNKDHLTYPKLSS